MVNLVVTEATVDPQNSLAIALAREHDPKMQRCIGIVTKIDLYRSHSHDGKSILNRLLRQDAVDSDYFPRGFVAVRGHSACIANGGLRATSQYGW